MPANPGLTDGDGDAYGQLFPGEDQYGRFMDCLQWVIKKNCYEFVTLGISPGDLGLHSARKGSCIYAKAGSTVCPPMVSICLQAMWGMGCVKEHYLQYEKAGDQYLGRVVSRHDINDVSFVISPPYFESGTDDDVKENVLSLLREFVVGGEQYCRLSMSPSVLLLCLTLLSFQFLGEGFTKMKKGCRCLLFCQHTKLCKRCSSCQISLDQDGFDALLHRLPPNISILALLGGLKAVLELSKNEIIDGVKNNLAVLF